MAILFAVVSRGTTVLAKHAWCGGNFWRSRSKSWLKYHQRTTS
uniref:Uncharacterized protein n=1 Tax=Anguilla anguilla TaxID=7936 RepID=A0A0E9S6Q6_ANGAN